MAQMNHLLLYADYEEVFSKLTDAQVGRLVRAMLHYLNTKEERTLPGAEKYVWPQIRAQLARNMEKYEAVCERNRDNSQKYWDSQKKNNMERLKNYPV